MTGNVVKTMQKWTKAASLEVVYGDLYFDSANNRYRNNTKELDANTKAALSAFPCILVEVGFCTKYGKQYTTDAVIVFDFENGWATSFSDYALSVIEYMSESDPFRFFTAMNAGMYAAMPTGNDDLCAFANFYIPE